MQNTRWRARSTLPPIAAAGRDEPLPLSFAQQRLWFLAQMEGVSRAYHMPLGLRLTGELDRGALHRALDRLIARHEALRTTFDHTDGQPVQRIAAENGGFALQEYDLRQAQRCREGELRRLAAEEANAAFDLRPGTAAPRAADSACRRRARAAAHHAPHRLRRLVDGRAGQRTECAV
jgi:hypothetical protein